MLNIWLRTRKDVVEDCHIFHWIIYLLPTTDVNIYLFYIQIPQFTYLQNISLIATKAAIHTNDAEALKGLVDSTAISRGYELACKKDRKLFLLLEILGHMYIRSIKNVIIINISELEFFFSYLDHIKDLLYKIMYEWLKLFQYWWKYLCHWFL